MSEPMSVDNSSDHLSADHLDEDVDMSEEEEARLYAALTEGSLDKA